MSITRPAILLFLAAAFMPWRASGEEWNSPPERASVVELYTSEGCSSCPPADRWLSGLKEHDALWRRVVPLAFHVDYWDYLGWRDRFAESAFSNRQRTHEALRNVTGVYTPGFVVNGKEWRGYFGGLSRIPIDDSAPGVLTILREGDEIRVIFASQRSTSGSLTANLAWLGFGLEDEISHGENEGRKLTHDFVVLEHRTREGAGPAWSFHSRAPRDASAIAAWISKPRTLTPIQAAGGWLER